MKTISCSPNQNSAATTDGQVNDFDNMDETEYLLKSPANAKHLFEAIAGLEAGKTIQVTLDDLDKL